MTAYQLQKTGRIWQGISDPIACRGSFSSLPGAYRPPDTFLQQCNRSDAAQLRACVVAAERGGHSTTDGPDTPLQSPPFSPK